MGEIEKDIQNISKIKCQKMLRQAQLNIEDRK